MTFKQWLANETISAGNTPVNNPAAHNQQLNQSIQTTLQDKRVSKLVSSNQSPQRLVKSLVPIAQDAMKGNSTFRGANTPSVTPLDVTKAVLPKIQSKPGVPIV